MKISWDSSTVVAGRYQIKRLLGQGGMGAVYEAFDPNLDKPVAIKVLLDPLREDQSRRFQMEATAAARLKHPNILSILDFGVTDHNLMFMVMEFVHGESLASRLKRLGPLTADECAFVVTQICAAMQHAHDAGVVHRDLKPANVMLAHEASDEESVKVFDFGIAKIVDRDVYLTRTGMPLGSPAYMSPEQVTVSDIDHRSDVYSLGCMIFECLEGRPPFRGESAIETMQLRLKENVPPLSRYKPDSPLGIGFNKLISKCTERDPKNRFHSIEEIQNAVGEIDTAGDEEQSATSEWKKERANSGKQSYRVNRKVVLFSMIALSLVGWSLFALTERIQLDGDKTGVLSTKLMDKDNTAFKDADHTVSRKAAPTDNANMAQLAMETYDPAKKDGHFDLVDVNTQLRPGNTWSLSGDLLSAQHLREFLSKNGADLRKLELSNVIISKECFEALRKYPIHELELMQVTFPHGSLDLLSGQTLHRLNIGISESSEYRSLSKLASLEELKVDGFLQSAADYPCEPFKLPPNVHLLCFSNFQNGLSPGFINELNGLKNFSTLQLRSCNFSRGMSFDQLITGLDKELDALEAKNCEIASFTEAKNLTSKFVEISVPSNITAEELAPFVRSLKVEQLDLKNDRDDLRLEKITPLFDMCPKLRLLRANHLPMNRQDFQRRRTK